MIQIKKHIPNTITCINLFCGCVAIPFALEKNWELVLILVFVALIADFLDGFFARILKVNSEIGAQLDSLADMVTFGLLPGIVMYRILYDICALNELPNWVSYFSFIIPIFSAIRLAKFNVDLTQNYYFKGLPTPANAVFILSLPLFLLLCPLDIYQVLCICITFSLLLVSNLPLIALKFKNYTIKDNLEKAIILLLSIPLIIFFKFTAFLFIIPMYILISLFYFNFFYKKGV